MFPHRASTPGRRLLREQTTLDTGGVKPTRRDPEESARHSSRPRRETGSQARGGSREHARGAVDPRGRRGGRLCRAGADARPGSRPAVRGAGVLGPGATRALGTSSPARGRIHFTKKVGAGPVPTAYAAAWVSDVEARPARAEDLVAFKERTLEEVHRREFDYVIVLSELKVDRPLGTECVSWEQEEEQRNHPNPACASTSWSRPRVGSIACIPSTPGASSASATASDASAEPRRSSGRANLSRKKAALSSGRSGSRRSADGFWQRPSQPAAPASSYRTTRP